MEMDQEEIQLFVEVAQRDIRLAQEAALGAKNRFQEIAFAEILRGLRR